MNKLQRLMRALSSDIDGALIISAANRQYYTGFASSAGILLVTRNKSFFITDRRYYEAACKSVINCDVILREERLMPQLLELLHKTGVNTLGIESVYTSLKELKEYEEELKGITLIGDNRLSDAITANRQIKSEAELELIARAQAVTDKAFNHILGFISPGRTEKEIALELEFFIRSNGGDGAAFNFIVISGANSSLPHGVSTDKQVENGDFIILDFGAKIEGYCSDMTRTVAVGQVSDSQLQAYETVLKAQTASLEAVRAGAVCSDIDKVARNIIETANDGAYKYCFGHGLGHSIGLDTHEPPFFHPVCNDVLIEGMVMTVEPGIYMPGEFGVRIEDLIAVTENGFVNFTASKKELIIL